MNSPVKTIIAAALTLSLSPPPAFARGGGGQCPQNNPNCIPKSQSKPKPVKKATPAKPPRPAPTPQPKIPESASLLLRWRILVPRKRQISLLQENDGALLRSQRPLVSPDEAVTPHAMAVDPNSTFSAGQRLQLGVITNQRGYLYAFSQRQGQSATLIHAGLLADRLLKLETEYYLPSDCGKTPPEECWYTVPAENGTVFFTVIFSRKKINNLSEKIRQSSHFAFDLSGSGDIASQLNAARGLKVRRDRNKFVSVWAKNPLADELVVTVLFTKKPTP